MRLSKVFIKNYRNFKDSEINFNDKSLIIGANDVGKTNLLNALRIVLDKSYSTLNLEPEDSDFNLMTESNEISIILKFSDIDDISNDYIYSNFPGQIKNGNMYIKYLGFKNSAEPFKFYVGPTLEIMDEVPRYKITGVINCSYLNSTRDLKSFLKNAKSRMINNYKTRREESEMISDNALVDQINKDVEDINSNLEKVSYIKNSTNFIKEELDAISTHNKGLEVKLSSFTDFDQISSNINLVTQVGDKNITIGGDGRSNQIYISMWIKEINDLYEELRQFTLFLIEEPEAHLFLPLQSMTIRRIINNIFNQTIMTTHSPQVVLEFKPNSIVRLYYNKIGETQIANNGCSDDIVDDFIEFGYRFNLITGNMFFADSVLLVEGYSEQMLYNFIASQIKKDVEKYNISIIPVLGIAFKTYSRILNRLCIPFSIRTDNDLIKNRSGKYNRAGINRLIDIYNEIYSTPETKIRKFEPNESKVYTTGEKVKLSSILPILNQKNLYLSDIDLEHDLGNSTAFENIRKHLNLNTKEEFVKHMSESKAINMFDLLQPYTDEDGNTNEIDLSMLENQEIFKPLNKLLKQVDFTNE